MSEETFKWLLPVLISGIIGAFTIIGNIWIQKHKTKGELSTTQVAAEDHFRDDLLQQNKELLAMEKVYREESRQMHTMYREELRQVEVRHREYAEKMEAKYELVLQTMRDVQTENAEVKLENKRLLAENKQLLSRVKELENHVARLEQQQKEQKYG